MRKFRDKVFGSIGVVREWWEGGFFLDVFFGHFGVGI
jgi:hypothetical protein